MDKLFISADIEGVCGIADWKETELSNPESAYFRAQMTKEVAAVCEAALEAGVKEIVVKDAHDSGRNIDPSALPENVKILRAWTRDPYVMMAGLDSSFGGAVFVGYHSAGGSNGNPLAHTMNTNNLEVRINGDLASEFHVNAYSAASLGVPCLLLTGDRLLCEGAQDIAPGIRTVAVSEGMGNASLSINPGLALKRIGQEARAALLGAPPRPITLPKEFRVDVIYRQHFLAHRASFYPGVVKEGALAVRYTTSSWLEVLRFLFFTL